MIRGPPSLLAPNAVSSTSYFEDRTLDTARMDHLSTNPIRSRARQEHNHSGCVLRIPDPPDRTLLNKGCFQILRHPPRVRRSGVNGVHGNASTADLFRQ